MLERCSAMSHWILGVAMVLGAGAPAARAQGPIVINGGRIIITGVGNPQIIEFAGNPMPFSFQHTAGGGQLDCSAAFVNGDFGLEFLVELNALLSGGTI